jgi:hypothetical protein
MPGLSISATDFAGIVSVLGSGGGFGYGYGSAKGQIGIAFAGAAAQTIDLAYGVATTVTLGRITQSEPSDGGLSAPGRTPEIYSDTATDEAGKTVYSLASGQPVYTGAPNPGTTSAGGFYSPFEGTDAAGTVAADNTIWTSNGDLDVPLAFTVAEGASSSRLGFLAALTRRVGATPAGTTGQVLLYHGYIADPDVDYVLRLGAATTRFANGDTLSVSFAAATLSDNPSSAPLVASFLLTPALSLSLSAVDANKAEGNAGSTPFTFAVSRSGDSTGTVTATYAVSGSGANPAGAADFAGGVLPSGTITLGPGENSKTFTIAVAGDRAYEPAETFAVTLSSPGGTFVAAPTATGTILNDDPGAFLAYQNTSSGQSGVVAMDPAAAGAPGYLQWQYIVNGTDDIAFSTQVPNVFVRSGSGFDAIQVVSGTNVLDGGLGSNFLTGGSGNDTFFTDARSAGVVWNTLRNFHAGDAATLWGFTPGVSSYSWEPAVAGAPGSEGATLRANIVGGGGRVGDGIDASITFTGLSVAQAKGLQLVTGTQPAGTYLYIYNPGV